MRSWLISAIEGRSLGAVFCLYLGSAIIISPIVATLGTLFGPTAGMLGCLLFVAVVVSSAFGLAYERGTSHATALQRQAAAGVMSGAQGAGMRPLKPLRGWRRLAVHSWSAPRDPSVYAVVEVPMAAALAYIDRLRRESGVKVTATHLVARGVALAIGQFPQLNGIVARGRIMLRDTVDIFFQVAIDGGRELSGIKISRVDEKSAVECAQEMEARVATLRAHRDHQAERTKSLLDRTPLPILGPLMRAISYLVYDLDLDLSRFGIVKDEFGSAMVTNVGPFGLAHALAPLVPFNRTPLLVLLGEVEDRPVAEAGRVVVRPMMKLGVTFDHRFMDGFHGGAILQLFRAYLEDPARFEKPQSSYLAEVTTSRRA